jgi:reactive intermediate/imine deaminase
MPNAGLAWVAVVLITGVSVVAQSGKRIVNLGPPPIGPYSAAVVAGDFVYVSGALATADDGKIAGATAGEQTTLILQRMAKVLEASGASMSNAAAVMVYLTRASDFAGMNEAYRAFWPKDPPTRTTVVTDLVLPGALVEISMVAVRTGRERTVVHPPGWIPSPNPYSYGIKSGDTLFLSGLISRNGRDNSIVEGDMTAQVKTVMVNAGEILKAAGMGLDDVVSAKVYITDTARFQEMNAAYRALFTKQKPARATVKAALTGPQYLVEITMVAVAGPKEAINTSDPPSPNLSSAIRAGGRLFLSGMLGNTEATRGDAGAQTRETLSRIDQTLAAAGYSRGDVVEGLVYLTEVANFGAMNDPYRAFFTKDFPARATVRADLVAPDGLVEIMVVAAK